MVSLNSRKAHNAVGTATTDYESYSMRFQTRDTYRENTFGAVSRVPHTPISLPFPLILIAPSAQRT